MISLDDLKNCLSSFYKELFHKDIENEDIEVYNKDSESCSINLCKFEGSDKYGSSIDLYCETGWENSNPIIPGDILYAFALYRNGKDFFDCDDEKQLHNVITKDKSLSKYYDEECYDSSRIKEKQLFLQCVSTTNNRKGKANAIYISYYFKQSEARKEDCLRFFLNELVDNNLLNKEEIEKVKQSILGKYLGNKDAYNDFPVEQWLTLFNESDVFTEPSLDVLKKILECDGKATCRQLADKYGNTPEHYNGICTKLAGRIAERLGLVLDTNASGNEIRWRILFDGQDVKSESEIPGNFIWILKPNLKIALERYLDDTKERQYFIAKITNAPEIFAESVIHNHWRMQQRYDHEERANAVTTNLGNAKQVKKGDILILDNGGGLYAYGVVKEVPENFVAKASLNDVIEKRTHKYPDEEGVIAFDDCSAYYEQNYKGCNSDWSQFIDVERWESFCPKNPVSNYGVQDAAGGLSVHSIFSVKSEWAKEKIKELDGHFATNRTEADKMREDNKSLLEQKKNIILQGAPGTGKTYATAALTLSMTDPNFSAFDDHTFVMARYEELRKEGLIAFTTFHQSMDYEDFVEGIKPQRKGDGVIYDIEDGIFKKIKDLALTNYEDSRKSDKELKSETDTKILFEKFCSKLEEDLLKNDSIELMPQSILKIREVFRKSDGSAKSISISRSANSPYQSLSLDMVQRDYQKFKNGEIKSYEDIKPKYESKSLYHGNAIYYYELFKKMKAFEEANGSVTSVQTEKVELKNYVLIIDEINRGNVSKIFGELISLLEADKRVGGDHPLTVTLPYSKESFSVPPNLYIIGTMNTTDRSVGSIDYAVRRRFAFVTLEADENKVPEEGNARNLFNAVKYFLNKSKYDMDIEDLMVGHSYFMTSNEGSLKMKWQYEILPLLMEYHKDGIISKSPLKDDSGNEIAGVKKDYAKFVNVWQKKESDANP